jgi:hypothetical protein
MMGLDPNGPGPMKRWKEITLQLSLDAWLNNDFSPKKFISSFFLGGGLVG